MAAVAAAPGLSALLSWPTGHLTEAASHWEAVGERSYGVAHSMWSDALNVDWHGETAEALRTDTHGDLMTTSGVVDQLQEAAGVARSGASELEAARTGVRYAVEDAQAAGFAVGEDLSVTDNDNAMQDAVSNPTKPPQFVPDQYGGTWRYDGTDATVCLNENGQATTAWANNSDGWRNP